VGGPVGIDDQAGHASLKRNDHLRIQFESTSPGNGLESAVECSEKHRNLVRPDGGSVARAHISGGHWRIRASSVQGESSPSGTESEDGDNVAVGCCHRLFVDGDRPIDK
jgi:hypothetical protein